MSQNNQTMHEQNMQSVAARQRVVKVLVQVLLYAFLIIMALIVLFPFYWMLNSSLKTLEEYRQSEASLKEAVVNAQATCDTMVKEAETKCAQMLSEANQAAAENAKNADALIAAENDRVEEARKAAAAKIDELENQLRTCIQALERIKTANRPAAAPKQTGAMYDYDQESRTDALADEISSNVEALVGTTKDEAPKREPKHPKSDTTTGKFTNLQFGRNYDPTHQQD